MNMLDAIAKPFGSLMLWLFDWTGNYGIAVILFALVVKLILLPFQLKSKKSMMRTSRMTPRLKELEKKYGNDKQKYQEQVNKLYKEEGLNPMSGCLWSLLPFPILIALYRAIRFPLTIMMGVSQDMLAQGGTIYQKLVDLGYNLANFSTARSASTYEQIYQSKFITEHIADFQPLSDKLQVLSYKFFGLDLGRVPDFKFWTWDWSSPAVWGPALGLFMLPIISALLSYVSMKVSNAATPQTIDAQKQTKNMMLWMPLISVWICFTMPGVMGIYWIAQSVFAIAQDASLNGIYNKQLDIEDADRIERQKLRDVDLETKRLETERMKAEGTTLVNPNTSKKKQQAAAAQKEVERKAAEIRADRLAKHGKAEEEPASQLGNRRYARGRAYVSDRYTDPDEAEEKTVAAAEESAEYEAEKEDITAEAQEIVGEMPEAEIAEGESETDKTTGDAAGDESTEEPDGEPKGDSGAGE